MEPFVPTRNFEPIECPISPDFLGGTLFVGSIKKFVCNKIKQRKHVGIE